MKEFSIVFYNCDFSTKLNPLQEVRLERYSHNMFGGPKTAYLTATRTADAWSWTKYLRCPVEIYGPDGRLNWYGYVNKIVIPHGPSMVGIGLDELFNYVTVNYDGGTTSAASNAQSITEYGQKEYLKIDSNALQAEGERSRDLYLSERKYPRPAIEFSGSKTDVSIECYGWYSTLGWKYYTNAGTSDVSNTDQIEAIVTSCGQFLRGTQIESAAGITSSEEQDGKTTALVIINKLLNAGTSNARQLLARVDKDRYLHIHERTAEPPTGTATYLLQEDGNLQTLLGAKVPPEWCIVSDWVAVRAVPDMLAGLGAMRPFYIESAEYQAEPDRTTYRPAGAYDQVRLARYIQDVIGNGGGGTSDIGGVGGIISLSYAYAWANSLGVADLSDSRDIEITSTDFANLTSSVVFTILTPGTYLIGISGACSDPAQQYDASVSKTGGGTFLPLTGTAPQMSGFPYSNGITYGAVVTLGVNLAASCVITCSLGSGTSAATFLQGYAWIVKLGV
jgi:hypothetical protein